jgi:DNA-binding transcriptional ArsR family regulator
MTTLANKFKALSEDVRLQILALISQHGELCVCEVERLLEISQSKASRHLRYLLNAGLVRQSPGSSCGRDPARRRTRAARDASRAVRSCDTGRCR